MTIQIWMPNRSALSWIQLIVNLTGFFGNIVMFSTLRAHRMSGKWPTILFLCQSVYDSMVCFQSAILSLQPSNWLTSNESINQLLCHMWHSQFTYWLFVQLSIGNLVLVGLERYLALVHPMKYENNSKKRIFITCMILNFFYNLLIALPNTLESRISDKLECVQDKTEVIEKVLLVYCILWFILIYSAALICLVFFYTKIIYELKKSSKTIQATKDIVKTSEKATNQFTMISIIITIVYIICISYDAFFYLLGRTKLIKYEYHTIQHQIGEFSVSLNSFANPVIYFFFIARNSCITYIKENSLFEKSRKKKIPLVSRERNRVKLSKSSLNNTLNNNTNNSALNSGLSNLEKMISIEYTEDSNPIQEQAELIKKMLREG